MRTLQKLSIAVLATAISVTALAAQGRATTGPRQNRNVMHPPGRAARPPQTEMRRHRRAALRSGPAAKLLRLRERLNLSDEQVKQLESMNANRAGQLDRAAMMRARADLVEARRGDGNLDKVKAAYERIARLRTDFQVAQLKARQDARQVLNAEQRSQVDQLSKRLDRRPGRRSRAKPS